MPTEAPQTDLQFPDEVDQIIEEVRQFRRLSPTERFLAIVDLMASGQTLMAGSPRWEFSQQEQAAEEERLRKSYQELFVRHGK
jgi:hypothetical protein